MPLLQNPMSNLLLGLASYKRPGLLQQAAQMKQQQYENQLRNQALQRQAEEDQRRRQMEDWRFKQQQQQAVSRENVAESLQGEYPPTRMGLMAADLYRAGQPGEALGLAFPQGPKPTGLMQNLEAAGLTPGTTAYQEAMQQAIMKPETVVNMGDKSLSVADALKFEKDGQPGVPGRTANQLLAEGYKLKTKDFTEGQTKSAGFANRMKKAESVMAGIKDYDPASAIEHGRAGVPLFGNYLASAEHQQYSQAASDWVRAKLRKESGAVIGDEEMAKEIETYFPMPGDSDAVIKQKAGARKIATDNLIAESQGAYRKLFVKGELNGKTVTRTGMHKGKKVIEYSDGSIEYAN